MLIANLIKFFQPLTVAFLLVMAGCSSDAELQSFDQFITHYEIKNSLSTLEEGFFPSQEKCSPFMDKEPYTKTISSALELISNKADNQLVKEAERFLTSDIQYVPTDTGAEFLYAARYTNGRILLYDRLFDYGCIEDVASTLMHELVHAVQMSRYLTPGIQPGERNLNASGREKIVLELEAESYQFYVSQRLGWVGSLHAEKMRAVSNLRRNQYKLTQKETEV